MFFLLDINVLIASSDPGHQFHEPFTKWFIDRKKPALATCPITENGFLRIYGHPDYLRGPGSPHLAVAPLAAIKNRMNSIFLPDDFSLIEHPMKIDLRRATSKQLTDLYLVGLARRHKGVFATFDRGIRSDWIESGASSVELIS